MGSLPLLSPAFRRSTFATRCLHVRHNARDPSGGRWHCERECCPVIVPKWRLPRHLGIFHMPQIYDMGTTALLPLRRKACWGFWFGHWLPHFFFFFSAPISSHLMLPLSWWWIPKSMQLLRYKFYLQTRPVSTGFFYQFYITNIAKTFSCKLHRSIENRRKHTVWFSGFSTINVLRWVLPTHTRTAEIQGKYRQLKHF